jgi:hypothetical protein
MARRRGIALAPFERDDFAVLDGEREIAALQLQRSLAEQLAPPTLQR